MKNKFCREIFSLTFLALLFLHLPAQQKALKIGDAIPDKLWTSPLFVVNAPQKTLDLSKDKDKLILLDFWATWCSACLINFPRMEALQQEFGDRIKMIPVTEQDRTLIEKFLTTKNGQRFNHLTSVVGDKMLTNAFPHKGIPFVVWIKDGKLVNTTDADQVTAENIAKVLGGETTALQTVIQMDRSRPLMLKERFDRQRNLSLLNYSILTKGAIPDIGGGGTLRYTAEKKVNGRQFTNLPLKDIYFSIGYELFQAMKSKENFSEKRMVIQVKDPQRISGKVLPDGTYEGKDLYSYEMIVAAKKADQLYELMLQDLTRYTAFHAAVEYRKTKCLVLKRSGTADLLATKGGALISTFPQTPSVLQNAPLRHMVNMINGTTPIALPLIDETDYKGNVDLHLSGITTLEKLKNELAKYGLTLIEEERELSMLVITDQ